MPSVGLYPSLRRPWPDYTPQMSGEDEREDIENPAPPSDE